MPPPRTPCPFRRPAVLALTFCAAWLSAGPVRAAAPVPAAPVQNETGAFIDQVVAAYGGKAALGKVKAYRMEGIISSKMQGQGPLLRLFSRPNRLRVVLQYPGGAEVRVVDGDQGWRSDATGKLAPVNNFLLGAMVAQAVRANLPWVLDERRAEAHLTAQGGKLQGIVLPLGNGLTLTAWVDPATHLILHSSTDLDMPGMKTEFITDYTDFRAVNGVMFPFHEDNYASGQSIGETVIMNVDTQPKVTESDFRP